MSAFRSTSRTDQRRIRQVAHPHRAVKALAAQVHHAVAQIQRHRDFGVPLAEPRHQRGHVAAAKPGGRGDAQVAAGLHATGRHAGFGIRQVGQYPLAVFQKRAALVRQADAPGGAQQQLHAQALLQRVQPPPDDGRGHALGLGGSSQATARHHGDKGFQGF